MRAQRRQDAAGGAHADHLMGERRQDGGFGEALQADDEDLPAGGGSGFGDARGQRTAAREDAKRRRGDISGGHAGQRSCNPAATFGNSIFT
jgi:hypothetical protein